MSSNPGGKIAASLETKWNKKFWQLVLIPRLFGLIFVVSEKV